MPSVSMTVNGKAVTADVDPRTLLVQFLRENLRLFLEAVVPVAERAGVRLTFSPETPNAGDTVFLQATVLDASGFPLEKGKVDGKITSPGGRTERLDFAALDGGWGVFKSSFVPKSGGPHKILLTADSAGRKLETEITVSQPLREKVGQPANFTALRELAALTGGAFGPTAELAKVIEQITLLPEPKPLEQRIRLWADPWWAGSILGLLDRKSVV